MLRARSHCPHGRFGAAGLWECRPDGSQGKARPCRTALGQATFMLSHVTPGWVPRPQVPESGSAQPDALCFRGVGVSHEKPSPEDAEEGGILPARHHPTLHHTAPPSPHPAPGAARGSHGKVLTFSQAGFLPPPLPEGPEK